MSGSFDEMLDGCDRFAGSFRDPSGYVFRREGRIFRAVDEPYRDLLGEMEEAGLLERLIQQNAVVRSRFVDDAELARTLAGENRPFTHFIEHDVLRRITFPYEWSVSMLADAGVCTIDLQLRLLESGYALKDATAYNIQFVHSRPVFIDLGSFERPSRLDIWFALGQFEQMFVYPLLLVRRCGWDLRSYFLPNLAGRSAEQVVRCFGRLGRLRPSLLMDVTLPAMLNRWSDRRGAASRELIEKKKTDPGAQKLNLQRLRRKILKLAAGYRPGGVWSGYTQTCTYDRSAEEHKKSLVGEFLRSTRPRTVLDLGCNTGDYSLLAAESGAAVVAADSDHDAVELLYRRVRESRASVTPMVVDACNPSPGIGYMNRERAPFTDRSAADCVFALALLHHLLVSGNLPPAAIRDLLHRLSKRDVVLEFVPRHDAMFERLMKFRVDLFGDLTLQQCREIFRERFQILNEKRIVDTDRTLLFLRKV